MKKIQYLKQVQIPSSPNYAFQLNSEEKKAFCFDLQQKLVCITFCKAKFYTN